MGSKQTGHLSKLPYRPGIAMLLVLIAVAMEVILSTTFLSTQSTTTGIAQNVVSHAQARAIA